MTFGLFAGKAGAASFIQRVDLGASSPFTDSAGNIWSSDRAFTTGSYGYIGGSPNTSGLTIIANTTDDPLYASIRYGTSFEYNFTVPNGSYQVTLKLAEVKSASCLVGARVFNVSAEGILVIAGHDSFARSGCAVPADRIFTTTVSDGVLNLNVTSVNGYGAINAIEVVSLTSPSPTPTPVPTTTPAPTTTPTPTPTPAPTPNPVPEGLSTIHFTGPITGRDIVFNIYIPIGYNTSGIQYPVLYNLHGSGQNSNNSNNDIVRGALGRAIIAGIVGPMIIVFPNNTFPEGNSMWADSFDGAKPGETHVIRELVPYIDANYRTIPSRNSRLIQGMSMGGVGTLAYAYNYPELFCCAVGYASALLDSWQLIQSHHPGIFNDEADWRAFSPWDSLFSNITTIRANNMAVRLVVGALDTSSEARIVDNNRLMRDNLISLAVPVEHVEVPGIGHDFAGLLTAEGNNSFRFFANSMAGIFPTPAPTPTPTPTPTSTPVPAYIQRVDSGSSSGYTDSSGSFWSADRVYATGSYGYLGGSPNTNGISVIASTNDDPLYVSTRYGASFEYRFTVPNGTYQVTLKLAEIKSASCLLGARVFNVSAEGVTVITLNDTFARVGCATPGDRTFTTTVSDGVLNLNFPPVVSFAAINAIEVIQI